MTDLAEAREPAVGQATVMDGMAARVRDHDWASTPLGARAGWPDSLRTLVDLMLGSAQPMFMAWGPQKTWLYNDAFVPILGAKHPAALGAPALDQVWAEAKADLTPLFDRVFGGEPVQMDDFALQLDRDGALEEAHFSFSYTPVRDERGAVAGLFGVCTETTSQFAALRDREAAEAALRQTAEESAAAAERVALALSAGAIVGTWVWDVRNDHFQADAQFAVSFGLDPALCSAGLPIAQVMASIHPDDLDGVSEAIAEAQRRGGPYRYEYRVLRADGVWRWIEASGEVELDAEGRPVRFPGVLVDIEERRRTAEALAQANNLLRTFMAAVPGVIFAKDLQGRLLVGNRGTEQLLGRRYEDFVGKTDMDLLEDKVEAAAIMATDRRIMQTRVAEQIEEQVTFPDGSEAWWHSTKAPLLNEAGEVIGLVGSSVDITERRRAEEHRLLLLNELNHRVKNTLAVVQGLARQTFRNAADIGSATDSFESRLAALSRAHNLLTEASWSAADLREIVEGQVGDLGRRAFADGPAVALPPQMAVNVALALHELATNARKYGALSNEAGRVDVRWSVDVEPRTLRLRWEESGGPLVSQPARRGFGARLLERALVNELGGQVKIHYLPQGLVCEVAAVLPG